METFTVTTMSDLVDDADGQLSLREVLQPVNDLNDADGAAEFAFNVHTDLVSLRAGGCRRGARGRVVRNCRAWEPGIGCGPAQE